MKSGKKTAAIIMIIVAVAAVIVVAAVLIISAVSNKNRDNTELSKPSSADVTGSNESETPDSDPSSANRGITNIVYLGIDKEEDRSDVMMVLSINKEQNRITVVSLLRDSKVTIEGCSVGTKLGYAYKWGGEQLALRTINQNFGTDLKKYISMQFEDVAAIVDSVGGVDIDITEEEVKLLNSSAASMGYEGAEVKEGLNTLCGIQAVAYSRIRSTEGGEYIRASRQQNVIRELFRKVRSMSSSAQISFINILMDNMKSNMFFDELSDLTEMDMGTLQLDEYTIPDKDFDIGLWSGWEDTPAVRPDDPPLDEKQWLWIYDLEAAGERLKSYIN